VIDLGVLDTVIAMVVVILLLSLIAQSIQTAIKKFSRVKSRQIEKSLKHLFDRVLNSETPANKVGSAPATKATDKVCQEAEDLYKDVMEQFGQLGRFTMTNALSLESISKADLSRVVAALGIKKILPPAAQDILTEVGNAAAKIRTTLTAIEAASTSPTVVEKAMKIRAALTPVLSAVLDPSGNVNVNLLVRNVVALPRELKLADLDALLDQIAAEVPALKTQVSEAKAELATVNAHIVQVTAKVRARIDDMETWYDTAMQGFEERYARHMRTFALVLGLTIAFVLNADIFFIFNRLSKDDLSRQRVINQGQVIQTRYAEQMRKAVDASKTEPELEAITRQLQTELQENTKSYNGFAVSPLERENWGDDPRKREWWGAFFGCLVMGSLISLGAPFWQDTLESIFALKNLLRGKGEIKKVEQKPGEGNATT
jgi:hypothetical protein